MHLPSSGHSRMHLLFTRATMASDGGPGLPTFYYGAAGAFDGTLWQQPPRSTPLQAPSTAGVWQPPAAAAAAAAQPLRSWRAVALAGLPPGYAEEMAVAEAAAASAAAAAEGGRGDGGWGGQQESRLCMFFAQASGSGCVGSAGY